MSARNDNDASPQPEISRAVEAMVAGRLADAREMLEALVSQWPRDAVAKRLLAEVAARGGALDEAERLLREALECAPDFTDARVNLASVLHSQSRFGDALTELRAIDPPAQADLGVFARQASALGRLGRFDEAISAHLKAIEHAPGDRHLALHLGHLLSAVGDRAGAIASYRRALELSPGFGSAWWSLANLKIDVFGDNDIAAMEQIVASGAPDDALLTNFALGKAYEDRGDVAAAFACYSAGNRLKSKRLPYRPDKIDAIVGSSKDLFTPAFFEARSSAGCDARGPIFIVGMPRSGSTLLEQILACHPLVEGLSELPYIPELARRIETDALRLGDSKLAYPQALETVSDEQFRQFGTTYLERVKDHRRTDHPYFVDKMPNNWMHLGFIWLVLPHATIIDIRRNPVACGLSNLKQHFAAGQEFTYGQEQFAHHYRSYVDLMRHWDAVKPGAVQRVIYEHLVADPEKVTRDLLERIGLPFDPACLSPHSAKRAVATPSAEQVRQPISAADTERWREFEQWLGELKTALGPTLEVWAD